MTAPMMRPAATKTSVIWAIVQFARNSSIGPKVNLGIFFDALNRAPVSGCLSMPLRVEYLDERRGVFSEASGVLTGGDLGPLDELHFVLILFYSWKEQSSVDF